LDARLACFLGLTLADDVGSSNVAGTGALVGQGFADFGLKRGSADEHAVAFRRNDGCVYVLIGAEHRKPVHALRGNLAAGSRSTTQAGLFVVHDTSLPVRLLLLGLFENHAFILITYALALVGFGATEGADLGGHLTDDLLVDALDHDFSGAGALDGDPFRDVVDDVVGETKLQPEGLALHLATESDTDQVELALETVADAHHHVVDQGTHGAGHGHGMMRVVGLVEGERAVIETDFYVGIQWLGQGTLGALDRDLAGLDGSLNTR